MADNWLSDYTAPAPPPQPTTIDIAKNEVDQIFNGALGIVKQYIEGRKTVYSRIFDNPNKIPAPLIVALMGPKAAGFFADDATLTPIYRARLKTAMLDAGRDADFADAQIEAWLPGLPDIYVLIPNPADGTARLELVATMPPAPPPTPEPAATPTAA